VQVCGETFTNQKVSLTDNLDCGGPRPPDQDLEDCAVKLNGPEAEIDCNNFTLSQVASPPVYNDGPFLFGICLRDNAKVRNCNVQQFNIGIDAENGGEVVNSVLSSNYYGMYAYFDEDSTVTIEDT
jgi:hypothetical protein